MCGLQNIALVFMFFIFIVLKVFSLMGTIFKVYIEFVTILLVFFFFMFWVFWPFFGCGILVPPPGIEPVPPAVEARGPKQWTDREVPCPLFDAFKIFYSFSNKYCVHLMSWFNYTSLPHSWKPLMMLNSLIILNSWPITLRGPKGYFMSLIHSPSLLEDSHTSPSSYFLWISFQITSCL